MSFWVGLFRKESEEETSLEECPQDNVLRPKVRYEEIPGSLDLGWYWSENKEEVQMAKIAERDRATHFYVVGGTGTGKTRFLEFLVQQDIAKGNGFGIIDPHGDLIEDVKGFLACYCSYHQNEEILDRVVLVDPTDPKFTVTFNPLETLPGVSVAEQANELVSAFRKIWSDSWGIRMEDLMRNSLIALGEVGLTLADLPRFLTRRDYRQGVLEKVHHPIAQEYFRRFDTITDRSQITWIEPVMNKMNAFLSDERVRQMFSGPKSTFNLRDVMDHEKILLVKLDKGKLKDAADLLGSLLMAKIQMAAFSRSDLPQSKRTPFYLYIDEFQNFASESFAVVLSEARKYGLSLIMAHQTLAQIPDELRSIILGNTGVQVYFRLNRQDAQLLAKEAFEYSGYNVKTMSLHSRHFWTLGEEWERHIGDLQNLPPRVCYVKHKIQGGVVPLQTYEIDPPWQVLGMKEGEYVAHLRALPFGRKYLVPRKEVAASPDRKDKPAKEEADDKPAPKKKQGDVVIKSFWEVGEEPTAKAEEVTTPSRGGDGQAERPVPAAAAREQRQHRRLQLSIKQIAEERGYRATIEQPTPDGLGRVDVSLERDGRRIACEVCVTTTNEHELSNIEKCLRSGYDKVILCSSQKRILAKVKTLALQHLRDAELQRVYFLQPEDLASYLQEQPSEVGEEETLQSKSPVSLGTLDSWQERVWQALRHLDDRSALNQTSLARLAYIQRLAEREYRGSILARGLALRETLIACIDRIIEQGKEPGLKKTCEFLRLVKEGSNLTAIAEVLGLSREQVTRYHKKKAVDLVTQEFLRTAKTRKSA